MATDLGTAAAFGAVSGLSVLADPSLQSDLSKPALALATALDQGVGQALGFGKGLSEAGIDAAVSIVGDLASVSADVADIVGGIIQVVPILGQLVGVVLKVMSFGLASSRTPAQRCQEWQKLYAAVPTGSVLSGGGQPFVPADYFARIVDASGANIARAAEADAARTTGRPVYSGLITPGDRRYRSLLGMALMLVTEGTMIDENDLSDADWKSGKPPSLNPSPPHALGLIDRPKLRVEGTHMEPTGKTYKDDLRKLLLSPVTKLPDFAKLPDALKIIYCRLVRDYYEAHAKAWHRGTEDWGADDAAKNDRARKKRGLPRAWRLRFRGLRRGIESLHRKGDGGTGLWILYMDLLATAFERGHLSREFIRWNLIADNNLPCADGLADSIAQMASNWSNTIAPHYVQGQAKLDALLDNGAGRGDLEHPPALLVLAGLAGVTGLVALLAGRSSPPPRGHS